MEHVHSPTCGCLAYSGVQTSPDLLSVIDLAQVTCLNQKTANSSKSIFKDFDDRFDKQHILQSDCDGQVLLIIPFTSQVKVRAICIIGKDESTTPTSVGLYVNNTNIDFSLTTEQPLQHFPLSPNLSGQIYHTPNPAKFSRVHKLIMHLKSPEVEHMGVSYIQIKGQNSNIKRKAVQAVYEVQPAAQKKDIGDMQKNRFDIS